MITYKSGLKRLHTTIRFFNINLLKHITHGLGANRSADAEIQHQYRTKIIEHCLQAIKASDVIFCWINTDDTYGTIFELGYAKALKKMVFICVDQRNSSYYILQRDVVYL